MSLKGIFRWYICSLKKNQNATRPSEHPPVIGEKCQILHLGTEVSLKVILGGIDVDVILEQYSTDQSPPGHIQTFRWDQRL